MKPKEMAPTGRVKIGHHPEILDGLVILNLEGIKEKDPLAFASGYITGKLGLVKDRTAESLVPDYTSGHDLGVKVRKGLEPKPKWDLTVNPN